MANFIRILLPEREQNEHELTKSKILIYTLIISTLTSFSLFLANLFLGTNSAFPFEVTIIIPLLMLVIFKYTASFNIIGNLMSLTLLLVMTNLSLKSGGICSADTLAFYVVPLMAFIIANFYSGLFWTIAAAAWIVYLHFLTGDPSMMDYFRAQTLAYDRNYYLIIALFNLIFVFIVVSIFYFQNRILIKKLEAKNKAHAYQTQLLEQTQEKLKRSNTELGQYAHATSHDLKQPIRTINGFTSLLNRHLVKKDWVDEPSSEYIQMILKGTNNMSRLVTDLLRYAKLAAVEDTPLNQLPLESILDNVLTDLNNQITSNKVTITRSELPIAPVIPTKINQLFQNLISNAIKFRNKNRNPVIDISCKDGGEDWHIAISDNGIGIDKKYQKQIFAPFQKLHSDKDYAGSGIGLASCQRIVELHHGEIWVQSTFGEGATFYFSLPKKQETLSTQHSLEETLTSA